MTIAPLNLQRSYYTILQSYYYLYRDSNMYYNHGSINSSTLTRADSTDST